MTEINWVVTSMPCYPKAEGQTDVVFQVYWQCNGQEVVGTDPTTSQSYTGSVKGVTSVTYTAGSPYTPYNQLTQDQVLSWVWNAGVDKAKTEAEVQAQIDSKMNPPVVTPPLPWTTLVVAPAEPDMSAPSS